MVQNHPTKKTQKPLKNLVQSDNFPHKYPLNWKDEEFVERKTVLLSVFTSDCKQFTHPKSPNQDREKPISQTKILQKFLDEHNGYQFVQHNGQRIFEPCPHLELPSPPRGCEIFIGNIPKQVYEDRLIPLFETVGKIYKFRLMLDFNQKNRGYGFAMYFNTFHASQAAAKFNGYEMQSGVKLAVCKSVDNRRLYIGNIPLSVTQEDVHEVFNKLVDGVVKVIVYSSWESPDINRGFAFIEFENHTQASVARRQFHPRNLMIWDQILHVDWADPLPDIDPLELAQVSVIYVKNLPYHYTNTAVHQCFQRTVGPDMIKRTHKIKTYAFVHCVNRNAAEIVFDKLKNIKLDGQPISVEWARPRIYSAQARALQPPQHNCLSVPLQSRRRLRQLLNSRRSASEESSDRTSEP